MAEVGSFASRAHAEMAAGMLDAHGIRARVAADDGGGAVPHVAIGAHGFRVAVADGDAEAAAALLAGTEPDGDTSTVPSVERRVRVFRVVGGLTLAAVVLGVVVALLS